MICTPGNVVRGAIAAAPRTSDGFSVIHTGSTPVGNVGETHRNTLCIPETSSLTTLAGTISFPNTHAKPASAVSAAG